MCVRVYLKNVISAICYNFKCSAKSIFNMRYFIFLISSNECVSSKFLGSHMDCVLTHLARAGKHRILQVVNTFKLRKIILKSRNCCSFDDKIAVFFTTNRFLKRLLRGRTKNFAVNTSILRTTTLSDIVFVLFHSNHEFLQLTRV